MPQHVITLDIPRPVGVVFDFLARPANHVQLAPPELRLRLVEGPERVQLGARLRWKARRMGVTQSLANEVTAFEEAGLIEEEQRQGPFKRWAFAHRFTASAGGTRLVEELTYEPPGGMLGLLVKADAIRRDLEALFAYREKRLRDLFTDS
jgi:ligand-binding SRPBCC domain-containing protein